MAYKYKLKDGAAGRVFINTVTNDDGTITSQEPLNSPYVELVQETAPATNFVTGVAPQAEQPAQPVTSPEPITPTSQTATQPEQDK